MSIMFGTGLGWCAMTATTQAPTQVGTPAPLGTGGIRRVGSALALVFAPWGFVVANAAYAWAIRNGGGDETGAAALALSAARPLLLRLALLGGMVGCLLLVPAVLGAFRLAPTSRLVLACGSLMIAGYVCYFGVLITSFGTMAMAARGGPVADYAAVIDASQSDPWSTCVFPLFIVGNLLGTVLFAMGLLHSKAVPGWAALGILMWPALHVVGLVFFGAGHRCPAAGDRLRGMRRDPASSSRAGVVPGGLIGGGCFQSYEKSYDSWLGQ